MGWEVRRGKRYYYRTERVNGRVVKTYIGSGPAAEEQTMSVLTSERGASAPRLSTSGEFVAAAGAVTAGMGERLHLYETLDTLGSASSVELAAATCLPLWFIEGWLSAQAAGGYLAIDDRTRKYRLGCEVRA